MKTSRLRQLAIVALCLLTSSLVRAQGHQDHQDNQNHQGRQGQQTEPPAMTHEHAGHAAMTAAPQMAMDEMAVLPEVRDPHANSGGYTLSSGPYTLEGVGRKRLADEKWFAGLWVDKFETRESEVESFQEFSGFAWTGDSYQRLMLRSDLEWRSLAIEESRTELVYSRAIAPFWNMQLGARYDHGDNAHRSWLAFGVSGLLPYWIEVDVTGFVGPEGHSAATLEFEYDLLLSQRLILQPRAGMDFYGDSDLEAGHGKGLSKSEIGWRLRYDISRQFSPYVGYERVHRHGEAAALFEPFGQHRETQWLAGFRFWF